MIEGDPFRMDPAPSQPPPEQGVELAPGVFANGSALRFQFARSSGPGGQNVNKLNTKAELWVPLSAIRGLRDDAMRRLVAIAGKRLTRDNEIHISADTARTQESNRAAVMERLREMLVQAMHRPKKRRPTRPSRAAKRRRLESKRQRSETKSRRRGPITDG
jgi:ribosome-associated protein